jgi:HK97 family phage prohead protease
MQDAVDKAAITDEPSKDFSDMATMKNKDFAFKVKLNSDDPAGTIEGYVSAYGNVDRANEIVMPGAFADSLSRQKREGNYPLMLWQHDTREPIGVWEDLADDGKGLWGKGRLLINANVPTADKVYSLVKNDAVRGMSIGYREIDVEPGKDGEPTKLIKLDLLEASIVSFPANRKAMVENVKSEDENKAIKLWKGFEHLARCFRDGEPLSVKQFEEFLREAGFPKSVAVQIASVGYARSIRSESEGNEATSEAVARLRAAVRAFSSQS